MQLLINDIFYIQTKLQEALSEMSPVCKLLQHSLVLNFSHIRSLGAAGALAVDICICFHDTES